MLADSPRRAQPRASRLCSHVTLQIPTGSSTAGAQLCLHDSAKF